MLDLQNLHPVCAGNNQFDPANGSVDQDFDNNMMMKHQSHLMPSNTVLISFPLDKRSSGALLQTNQSDTDTTV